MLSYINKVSLVAFFITTSVVVYQIYNLKKSKFKEQVPSIPDFKEKNNFNEISNFTSLPSYLTKKENKTVNYSKFIFLTISLLTVIIIVFVVSLIKKNSITSTKQITVKPKISISATPTKTKLKDNREVIPEESPTIEPENTLVPLVPEPSEIVPTEITPTEIVVANSPSITPVEDSTEVVAKAPEVLPETSSWEKGFLIIGVAISTIFFSFIL